MTKVETKTQVGSWEDGFSPSSNQKPKKASKVKNELLTEVASDTTIHIVHTSKPSGKKCSLCKRLTYHGVVVANNSPQFICYECIKDLAWALSEHLEKHAVAVGLH